MKCANCEKELTTQMEVEHSSWLSEYYCSSKCATDRYFSYMESTPVDFENLPSGVEVVGYKLVAAQQSEQAEEVEIDPVAQALRNLGDAIAPDRR